MMHYLECSYTSFEASFKLYSEHFHKRHVGSVQLKLCSFL